jgi:hypothetical protein
MFRRDKSIDRPLESLGNFPRSRDDPREAFPYLDQVQTIKAVTRQAMTYKIIEQGIECLAGNIPRFSVMDEPEMKRTTNQAAWLSRNSHKIERAVARDRVDFG